MVVVMVMMFVMVVDVLLFSMMHFYAFLRAASTKPATGQIQASDRPDTRGHF